MQVVIRSPIPASPWKVLDEAPQATPKRAISTRPRVSKADLALSPKAEAVADAGGDADDVLQRPGHFDADDVVARIDAESIGEKDLLNRQCERRIGTGRDHRRGHSPADFFCMARPA